MCVLWGLRWTVLHTSRFHSTKLQQEFTATHPAAPHSTSRLFTIPSQTVRRWNVLSLALSLHCISHTRSHTLPHSFASFMSLSHVLAVCFFFLKAIFLISYNDRIPNWGSALPYQEARTSLTQTTGIPLWWCQMCCQMDQPWDACCKLTTVALL